MNLNVDAFFAQLSIGELADLELGATGEGYILDPNLDRIVLAANSGLTMLHNRYLLKELKFELKGIEGVLDYQLNLPNFISMLSVWAINNQCSLVINDANAQNGVNLVGSSKIKVPFVDDFELTYKANHPMIKKSNLNVRLDIPDTLLDVLALYINHAVRKSMGTEDMLLKANDAYARMNLILVELDNQNALHNSRLENNNKFAMNGWV